MPLYFNSTTPNAAWLSNFCQAPVSLDGVSYPSVEHAYQAAKTLDPAERQYICTRPTAAAAKAAGRGLTLRPDWDEVKLDVMENLLWQKFQQDNFKQKLLRTAPLQLVHYCPWGDTFWGVGRSYRGENKMGILLMEIRELLSRADMEKEAQ